MLKALVPDSPAQPPIKGHFTSSSANMSSFTSLSRITGKQPSFPHCKHLIGYRRPIEQMTRPPVSPSPQLLPVKDVYLGALLLPAPQSAQLLAVPHLSQARCVHAQPRGVFAVNSGPDELRRRGPRIRVVVCAQSCAGARWRCARVGTRPCTSTSTGRTSSRCARWCPYAFRRSRTRGGKCANMKFVTMGDLCHEGWVDVLREPEAPIR